MMVESQKRAGPIRATLRWSHIPVTKYLTHGPLNNKPYYPRELLPSASFGIFRHQRTMVNLISPPNLGKIYGCSLCCVRRRSSRYPMLINTTIKMIMIVHRIAWQNLIRAREDA